MQLSPLSYTSMMLTDHLLHIYNNTQHSSNAKTVAMKWNEVIVVYRFICNFGACPPHMHTHTTITNDLINHINNFVSCFVSKQIRMVFKMYTARLPFSPFYQVILKQKHKNYTHFKIYLRNIMLELSTVF